MLVLMWAGIAIGALILLALIVLAFPKPFVRLIARRKINYVSSLTLRAFPLWLLTTPFFSPVRTRATTIGSTILINEALWITLSEAERVQLLKHEIIHIHQEQFLGPLYLYKYIWLYIRYGYNKHPMEEEAREAAGERSRA